MTTLFLQYFSDMFRTTLFFISITKIDLSEEIGRDHDAVDGDDDDDDDEGKAVVLKTFKKIVFRASAERVQQVPIYWRIIPFDTKNSFRVSAERVESAPIYWRIIPFIKEAPTDQNCKWSPGK